MNQKGVSLLELMVVISIIGILSIIAVPAYFSYIKTAKLAEAYSLFGGFSTNVGVFYAMKGHYPSSLSSIPSLMTRGHYVLYMDYTPGWNNDPKLDMLIEGFASGEDTISWQWNDAEGMWLCNPADNPYTTIPSEHLVPPC